MHQCLRRSDQAKATFILSLFMPQNNFLKVVASTDGTRRDVNTSPNNVYEKNFDLRIPAPNTLALKAYHNRELIVIPDTSKADFFFFEPSQRKELKSVFACPLRYSDGAIVGLLFAESNQVDYFNVDEGYIKMIEEAGMQLGLRLSLETTTNDLLAI
jgi:GAF domain-containing protein